jgi:ACS family hexuronate transporter-like MFS transporter
MGEDSPTAVPRRAVWVWGVCGLLLLSMLLNYMDRMTLNQLADTLKRVVPLDNTKYSRLESAFGIGFALGGLLFGWLADRVNLRWLFPVAVGGWSLAGVCTGFVTSYESLLACRFALGVFEAGQFPCGLKATQRLLAPDRRPLGNSLLQGGGAIGAALTPLAVYLLVGNTDAWQLPFRVIGGLGIFWVAGWVLTVRGGELRPPPMPESVGGEWRALLAVWADRRYWALLAMNLCMNCHWHGYRVWLPLLLREQEKYDRLGMTAVMSVFYIVADVGMFTIGAAALVLAGRGWGVHRGRMLLYGLSAAGCLLTVAVGLGASGPLLLAVLPLAGGAGLALFPLFYSFSQELSTRHQGKVTGTLSCLNWLGLAAFQALAGWMTTPADAATNPDARADYGPTFLLVAVLPLLSFLVVRLAWPREEGAGRPGGSGVE